MPKNRGKLADRVIKAAETSLAAQHYVSPIGVLVGIGWLDPGAEKRWRQGQKCSQSLGLLQVENSVVTKNGRPAFLGLSVRRLRLELVKLPKDDLGPMFPFADIPA